MLPQYFPLFPESASTISARVDALYFFILGVTIFFTTLVALLILVFSIKYRKDKHPVPVQIHGSIPLEIFWTLVPLGIVMRSTRAAACASFASRRTATIGSTTSVARARGP